MNKIQKIAITLILITSNALNAAITLTFDSVNETITASGSLSVTDSSFASTDPFASYGESAGNTTVIGSSFGNAANIFSGGLFGENLFLGNNGSIKISSDHASSDTWTITGTGNTYDISSAVNFWAVFNTNQPSFDPSSGININVVPEPSSSLLLIAGLLSLGFTRRRI